MWKTVILEILDMKELPVPSPRFLLPQLEWDKVLVAEKGVRECWVQLAVISGAELSRLIGR